jgi:hypothetical protein
MPCLQERYFQSATLAKGHTSTTAARSASPSLRACCSAIFMVAALSRKTLVCAFKDCTYTTLRTRSNTCTATIPLLIDYFTSNKAAPLYFKFRISQNVLDQVYSAYLCVNFLLLSVKLPVLFIQIFSFSFQAFHLLSISRPSQLSDNRLSCERQPDTSTPDM